MYNKPQGKTFFVQGHMQQKKKHIKTSNAEIILALFKIYRDALPCKKNNNYYMYQRQEGNDQQPEHGKCNFMYNALYGLCSLI